MAKASLFLFFLLTPPTAAALDADTLEMVEAFIKAPTASLPPDSIERFIGVDSAELPDKLKKPYEAKKLELLTLRNIARSKKKGSLRSPKSDCSPAEENRGRPAKILLMAGYGEISEEEAAYLVKETRCTERELMCEFSLTTSVEKRGKRRTIRYFLHENDVLFGLVARFRGGSKNDTNFFSGPRPRCYH